MSEQIVLMTHGLTKSYGKARALRGVDLEVRKATCVNRVGSWEVSRVVAKGVEVWYSMLGSIIKHEIDQEVKMSEANVLTIEYSPEVLWTMQQAPDEFEAQARLLLAVKLYEIGRLSTGLAARLAGVPRVTFVFLLGQYRLSPFGETADELNGDLDNARRASHRQ